MTTHHHHPNNPGLLITAIVFIPYLAVSDSFKKSTIMCTAPSKTFNLAGMHLSNIIIPDQDLRNRYKEYITSRGMSGGLNPLALLDAEIAYLEGEDWLSQVRSYIWSNYAYLRGFIQSHLPILNVSHLEGTYLAWIDFRALNLSLDNLESLIQQRAGLLLNQGYIFGEEGAGFQRMNIACPRSVLELALRRLKTVLKDNNSDLN